MIAEYVGAISDQGPYRTTNQDAYWVSDTNDPLELGELYIVTDGVGGQEDGAVAAQMAAQVISTDFYQQRQAGRPITEALNLAIHQANKAIYDQAQARGGIKMGCTVVAAVWHQKSLYVAHVGDARIYLLHKNELTQLTRDDSWVQQQIDAGIITAEEAKNHEYRNVVTQALGNKLDIIVHQSQPKDVHSQDKLLLCTDGLHGVVTDDELSKLLKNNEPQSAADALIEAAIAAKTEDNVTAVVVQLQTKNIVAGAATGKRRLPIWAIITVVLIILLISWGVYTVWSSNNGPAEAAPGLEAESESSIPTVMPTAAIPTDIPPTEIPPTAAPTNPPPTEVPPTETPPPTEIPTETPTETPTPTAIPPTAVPTDPPPTESSTPESPPPPGDPIPPEFAINDIAIISSIEGANVRNNPGINSDVIGGFNSGGQVAIVQGPEQAVGDNFIWWLVRGTGSQGEEIEGWVANINLAPAPSP